jgi:hypothetical protein
MYNDDGYNNNVQRYMDRLHDEIIGDGVDPPRDRKLISSSSIVHIFSSYLDRWLDR